jgi:hypothetical protein
MSIDNFTSRELNIKDLTLEEPRKSTPILFDVERDISDTMWGRMTNELSIRLHEQNTGVNKVSYLYEDLKLAHSLLLLDSNRVDTEQFAKINKHSLLQYLNQCFEERNYYVMLELASVVQSSPIDLSREELISDEKWHRIRMEVNGAVRGSLYGDSDVPLAFASEQLLNLAFFDPEKIKEVSYRGTYTDKVKKRMAALKETSYGELTSRSIYLFDFLKIATAFKLLIPEEANGYEFGDEVWKRIRESIDESKNSVRPQLFAERALHAKFLASESVKISRDGVEFVMPKRDVLINGDPSIPESRKF